MKKEIQGTRFNTLIGWLFSEGFVMITADGTFITRQVWDKGITQYVEDYELRSCINDEFSTAIEMNGFKYPEKFYMYHPDTHMKNRFWYTFYFEHLVPADWCKNIVINFPANLYEYEKFRGNLGGKRPNKKMIALNELVDLAKCA